MVVVVFRVSVPFPPSFVACDRLVSSCYIDFMTKVGETGLASGLLVLHLFMVLILAGEIYYVTTPTCEVIVGVLLFQ